MIYWYFQIEVFRFLALFFSFLSRGLEVEPRLMHVRQPVYH